MTAKRSLDVLIVSFNTRELLRDCLRSIESHRPPAAEIELRISVLDNASDDGSAPMIRADFPSVRLVLSDENLGFGRANNQLAASSTADYLLLLNSDTIWTEDVATPLIEVLESWPGAGITAPRLVEPDGTLQLSSQSLPTPALELADVLRGTKLARVLPRWDTHADVERMRQTHLADERTPRETEFIWATCWMLRRSLVEQHGLFRPEFHMYDEDLDFCLRMRHAGVRLVYCPNVELVHLGGGSSRMPASKLLMMRRARARFYRLNHGRRAWLAVAVGVTALRVAKLVKHHLARRVRALARI
jgi:GT2 family glycosyltransferase